MGLGNLHLMHRYLRHFDEIYQLAADMGGAGFIFTGENDADIMHNSASINLNILNAVKEFNERSYTFKNYIEALKQYSKRVRRYGSR